MNRLLAASLVALSLGVACSSAEPTVGMTADHSFDPESLSVAANQAVTFTNDSDESHTVTAYEDDLPQSSEYFSSGEFSAEDDARANVAQGLIKPGEEFSLTLEEPGTYKYFCIPHEGDGMVGAIVVEE